MYRERVKNAQDAGIAAGVGCTLSGSVAVVLDRQRFARVHGHSIGVERADQIVIICEVIRRYACQSADEGQQVAAVGAAVCRAVSTRARRWTLAEVRLPVPQQQRNLCLEPA